MIRTLKDEGYLFEARIFKPPTTCDFRTGIRGLHYSFNFLSKDRVLAQLYIDFGDKIKNKRLFDSLLSQRQEIEEEFGLPLEWEKPPDGPPRRGQLTRACRIAVYRDGSINAGPEQIEQLKNWGIQQLLQFKKVLEPRLRNHYEGIEENPLQAIYLHFLKTVSGLQGDPE